MIIKRIGGGELPFIYANVWRLPPDVVDHVKIINNLSLQIIKGCKDIGHRKFKFVTKTWFLWNV